MSQLVLANPFSYPLHISSWQRPSGDRGYRVTNPFGGTDPINGGAHKGLDVGNFRTGDIVRSPAAGRGIGVRHTDGALGDLIELGNGIRLELWHLSGTLSRAAWTPLAPGQAIGATGATGARLPDGKGGTIPMPAHTHIELKGNGVPIDPAPYLPMVERAAKPITIGEDDVKIKGRFLRHVQNRRTALTTNSHFRAGVDAGDDESLGVLPAGTTLYPVVTVGGRSVGTAADRAEWHGALAYVAGSYHFGYVHSSVCAPFEAIDAADCTALENRLDGIATAAEGLGQAASAIVGLAKR
jgi:hypothetical protein